MIEANPPFPFLSGGSDCCPTERTHNHAFNPNGSRQTKSLGDACGMTQLGVHLVRVLPGRESTEYHTHHHDEEWIYVLAGHGTAEIGGRTCAVKAGDFMGFAAGSPAHTLLNDGNEDLVYLVGARATTGMWSITFAAAYVRSSIRQARRPRSCKNLGVPKIPRRSFSNPTGGCPPRPRARGSTNGRGCLRGKALEHCDIALHDRGKGVGRTADGRHAQFRKWLRTLVLPSACRIAR